MSKKIMSFFSILLATGLFTFMIYDLQHLKPVDNFNFLNIPVQKADSLIEHTNTETKLRQIIFFYNMKKYDKKNIFNVIYSDTLHAIMPDTGALPPLCITDFNSLFPKSNENIFFSASEILSVPDTSETFEYLMNLSLSIAKKYSISGFIWNFFKNFTSDDYLDTNIFKQAVDIYKKINTKLLNHKKFIILKFDPPEKKDTLFYEFYIKEIKKLADSSQFFFYVTKIEQAFFLRKEMKFNGLIFIKDSTLKDYKEFLNSEADILLDNSQDYKQFEMTIAYISNDKKYMRQLNEKARKIFLLRTWLEMPGDSIKYLTQNEEIKTTYDIYKHTVILLSDTAKILPLSDINKSMICYCYSDIKLNKVEKTIKFYKTAPIYYLKSSSDAKKIKKTGGYNIVFVINKKLQNTDTSILKQLERLKSNNTIIIVNFGIKENLKYLKNFPILIFTAGNNVAEKKFAIDAIFGGIGINGIYPFEFIYKFKSGLKTQKTRLRLGIPAEADLDADKLSKIDSIVYDAIRKYAFPGCQVLVARHGIVVFDKSYGYHTYQKNLKVKNIDVYDIASMTKIMATTLAAMKLYEKKKLNLDKPLKKYFKNTKINYKKIKPDTIINIDTVNPEVISTDDLEIMIKNKDTIHLTDTQIVIFDTIIYTSTPTRNIFTVTPRELLMHKSGIQPAMPILKLIKTKDYYEQYLLWTSAKDTDSTDYATFYKRIYSDRYIKDSAEHQVARGMYLTNNYFDTLWDDTKQLFVSSKKNYVYSDVNMILLQILIDTINGYSMDKFLKYNFYRPLGLRYTAFYPLKKFSRNSIIPTARDKYWRKQLLWGYVHDPSAALMGGMAGNAGLFSNARDLAIIAQMLLNKGTYGGKRYLQQTTIEMFTKRQPNSFRGLGFDMKRRKQIIAPAAPKETFGHTGFTGTCIWIDPKNEIIFIFLSNRVHPNEKNWKINRYKIRQKIHQQVYKALTDKKI